MKAFTKMALIILASMPLIVFSQDQQNGAEQTPYEFSIKVLESDDLAWFILSKPLRNHEILTTFEITFSRKQTNDLHIKQIENIYEHKGRMLKAQFPEADGLYSPDGKTVHLIKYTDDVERHHRISNARTIKNKQAYIWGEPLKINEPVFEISHDGSLLTKQPVLENTLQNWIKKGKAKDQAFDAILFKTKKVVYLKYVSSQDMEEDQDKK